MESSHLVDNEEEIIAQSKNGQSRDVTLSGDESSNSNIVGLGKLAKLQKVSAKSKKTISKKPRGFNDNKGKLQS